MNIRSIDDLIEGLTLQKNNLATYQTEVGATAQDITDVAAELDQLSYAVQYSDVVDENKKGCTLLKNQQFDGDPDIPLADYPVFSVATVVARKRGCLTLWNGRKARYRAAAGYTDEIGQFLGIGASAAPSAPTGGYKPTVIAQAAQSGDMFSVMVGNRGDSDMWDVLVKEVSDPSYDVAKSSNGKTTDVTMAPNSPPAPRQLMVRIQLRDGDLPYGPPSDIVLVTINP